MDLHSIFPDNLGLMELATTLRFSAIDYLKLKNAAILRGHHPVVGAFFKNSFSLNLPPQILTNVIHRQTLTHYPKYDVFDTQLPDTFYHMEQYCLVKSQSRLLQLKMYGKTGQEKAMAMIGGSQNFVYNLFAWMMATYLEIREQNGEGSKDHKWK